MAKHEINYTSLDSAIERRNRLIKQKATNGGEFQRLTAYIDDWNKLGRNPNDGDPVAKAAEARVKQAAAAQHGGVVNPITGAQVGKPADPHTYDQTKPPKRSKGAFFEQDELTQYFPLMQQLEQQYGLPTGILRGIARAETGHIDKWSSRTRVHSPAGAVGLMQFMPKTAKRYGIDPYNPEQAIRGAAMYLSDNAKQLNTNSPEILLASYNAGENNPAVKAHRVPKNGETNVYVPKAMGVVNSGYGPINTNAGSSGVTNPVTGAPIPLGGQPTPIGTARGAPSIGSIYSPQARAEGAGVPNPPIGEKGEIPAPPVQSPIGDLFKKNPKEWTMDDVTQLANLRRMMGGGKPVIDTMGHAAAGMAGMTNDGFQDMSGASQQGMQGLMGMLMNLSRLGGK